MVLGSVALWLLVGALGGFGVAGLMTIGILLLAAAAGLLVVGVLVPAIDDRGAPAILVGAATAPLCIAWWNRQGPGEFCHPNGCGEQLDPRPWAAVGIVLMLAGIALTWYAVRGARRQASNVG